MSELNAFRTELLTDSRNEANLSNGEDSEVNCYTKRALAFIDSTEELGGFPHDCHALGQRSDKSKWRIEEPIAARAARGKGSGQTDH